MKRKHDYRSVVIVIELLILLGVVGSLYMQQRAALVARFEAPGPPSTSTQPATIRSVAPVPPTPSVIGDKGGTTTIATSTNHWRGTLTPDGLLPYIEVIDGCGPHYEGTCLNARSGPSTSSSVVGQLRNGTVLPVVGRIVRGNDIWYQLDFLKSYPYLEYPERVTGDWYVNDRYVRLRYEQPPQTSWHDGVASTSKRIIVDRGKQMLYAYDGQALYMEAPVSTGLVRTPTPRGTFTIFRKTPSSYMQGPSKSLPLKQFYDLPGVPWDLYFTTEGATIHGAYWHTAFGHRYSHGCVNLSPADAYKLYQWAVVGTNVTVID